MSLRKLGVNSLVLGIGMVCAQGATVLVYLLVAQQLSPSGYGPLMGAIGVASLIISIADFGINSLTIRTLAQSPGRTAFFTETLSAKTILALVLGVSWVIVITLAGLSDGTLSSYWLLGPFISLSVMATTVAAPFRAAERMVVVSGLQMVEKVTALVVSVVSLLLLGVEPRLSLLLGLVAGGSASVLLGIKLLDEPLRRWRWSSPGAVWRLWRESISFGLSGLTTHVQKADVSIVQFAAGPEAAGLFAAPARFTGPLGIIPTAFSSALFPKVSGAGDPVGARRDALRGIMILETAMVLLLGCFFFAAPWLVSIGLGESYAGSDLVLRVYLVGMVFASINQPLAIVLQGEGSENFVARVVGTASVAGLAFVWIGSSLGGASGGAFGFVAQQVIILGLLGYRIRTAPPKQALNMIGGLVEHNADS